MKRSLTIAVVLIVVVIAAAATLALVLQPGGRTECGSTWSCAAGYPLEVAGNYGVAGEQCMTNSTYLFCVGGLDANSGPHPDVYGGSLTPAGNLTEWTQYASTYPTDVSGESCVVSSGYVYCVGGTHDSGQDDAASSYYAELESGGGLGSWFYTTPYPVPVDYQSCVASSSYIYCVGGNNETDGTEGTVAPSSSVWYAHLSASGIDNWSKTTPYPSNSFLPSCFVAGQDIFCIGGVDSSDNPLGTAYYATLSENGVGEWIPTTAYPIPATGQACAVSNSLVYCVGGATSGGQYAAYTSAVYSAPVTASGIGTWKEGPDYPVSVGTTCVISTTRIYCVGGYDTSGEGENNRVLFASLSSISG